MAHAEVHKHISHAPSDGDAYVGATLGGAIGAATCATLAGALFWATLGAGPALAATPGGALIGLYLGGLIGFALYRTESAEE